MKYLPILLLPCLLYAQEDPTFVKGATKKDVAIYNRDKDIVIEKEKSSTTLCKFKLIETEGKLSSCETGQKTQIVMGILSVVGSGVASVGCFR